MTFQLSEKAFAFSAFGRDTKLPDDCRPIVEKINRIASEHKIKLSQEILAVIITLSNSYAELDASLTRVGLGVNVPDKEYAAALAKFSITCRRAINQWTTVPPGNEPASVSASSASKSICSTPRDPKLTSDVARKRDGESCILTYECVDIQVAHIFAYSLASKSDAGPDLWALLECYLSPSDFQALCDYLLDSPDNDGQSNINRLENLISLGIAQHAAFRKGRLAFEPVDDSFTANSYRVKVRLIPGRKDTPDYPHKRFHDKIPDAFEFTDIKDDPSFTRRIWTDCRTDARICDGYEVTLTSPDPVAMPLPSPVLLKLHLAISRIVRLIGGALDQLEYDDEDDDNLGDAGVKVEGGGILARLRRLEVTRDQRGLETPASGRDVEDVKTENIKIEKASGGGKVEDSGNIWGGGRVGKLDVGVGREEGGSSSGIEKLEGEEMKNRDIKRWLSDVAESSPQTRPPTALGEKDVNRVE